MGVEFLAMKDFNAIRPDAKEWHFEKGCRGWGYYRRQNPANSTPAAVRPVSTSLQTSLQSLTAQPTRVAKPSPLRPFGSPFDNVPFSSRSDNSEEEDSDEDIGCSDNRGRWMAKIKPERRNKRSAMDIQAAEEAAQERAELKQDEDFGAQYDADTNANTFTDYAPARLKTFKSLKEHPDPVTETAALSSVMPPEIEYKLRIPKSTILEGRLTSLQLESIIYACQQHEKFLPSGEDCVRKFRAGFFMGDGPGVGKGRQIAGIILDNYIRGRTKAIWISVSADLVDDARRDLHDIGAGAIRIHDLKKCQPYKNLSEITDMQSGVMFSTYQTLVRENRLEQLLEWCGEDFEGVIAFDEAHKAKKVHFQGNNRSQYTHEEQDGSTFRLSASNKHKASKSASAVIALQDQLPCARIVYASATAATEPEHLLYAKRLGLWGPGTSFETEKRFVKDICDGGTGAMELLAMQMKQTGQYMARSLSFKGATFEVFEETLSADFLATYNGAVKLWSDLWRAVKRQGLDLKQRMQFWGAHLRFWSQMCMAAKVGAVVRRAQQALEEGKCVVIGLQNTGETATGAASQKDKGASGDEEVEDGSSTAHGVLRNFVEKHSMLSKPELKSFLERSAALQLPVNPLDHIIQALGGAGKVAEMTGRKSRQVFVDGQWTVESRCKTQAGEQTLNIQERKMFMSGKKLVAIISEAASTGISLQADSRVSNKRRRVHITLQLPWSADKAVQQMGRSHRSNQSSAPEFVLLMTPLGGEWRFASATAARLQQLGAITQGDRRAAGGSGIQTFAIDKKYGREALKVTLEAILRGRKTVQVPDFIEDCYAGDFEAFAEKAERAMVRAGLIDDQNSLTTNQFLNRLLGIEVELQGQIFSLWQSTMEALIRDAKRQGKFEDGIVDIGSDQNRLELETILHSNSVARTETRYVKISADRGVSWERAMELLADQSEELAGVYRKKGEQSSLYNVMLLLRKTQQIFSSRPMAFNVVRPNTGHRPEEVSLYAMRHEYERIPEREREAAWKRCHEHSEHHCGHTQGSSSSHCLGAECTYRRRLTFYHILTGSVLPAWNVIKGSMFADSIKVVRVRTCCGRRLVGVNIPGSDIVHVKARLSEEQERTELEESDFASPLNQAGPASVKTNSGIGAKGITRHTAAAGKAIDIAEKSQPCVKTAPSTSSSAAKREGSRKSVTAPKVPRSAGAEEASGACAAADAGPGASNIELDEAEVLELAKSGVWEDDDTAEALFRDGLRASEAVRAGMRVGRAGRRRASVGTGSDSEGGEGSAESSSEEEEEEEESDGSESEEDKAFAEPSSAKNIAVDQGRLQSLRKRDSAVLSSLKEESDSGDDDDEGASEEDVEPDGQPMQVDGDAVPKASALVAQQALQQSDVSIKDERAQQELEEQCAALLARLLSRPELSLSITATAVTKAMKCWIPADEGFDGVGEKLRGAGTPKGIKVPTDALKEEITKAHPSGSQLKVNEHGVVKVLSVLGFFAQALLSEIAAIARSSNEAHVTAEWLLSDEGLAAVQDNSLRALMDVAVLSSDEEAAERVSDEDEEGDGEVYSVLAEDDQTCAQIAKAMGIKVQNLVQANLHLYPNLTARAKLMADTELLLPAEDDAGGAARKRRVAKKKTVGRSEEHQQQASQRKASKSDGAEEAQQATRNASGRADVTASTGAGCEESQCEDSESDEEPILQSKRGQRAVPEDCSDEDMPLLAGDAVERDKERSTAAGMDTPMPGAGKADTPTPQQLTPRKRLGFQAVEQNAGNEAKRVRLQLTP